jgi:hypothetical protein
MFEQSAEYKDIGLILIGALISGVGIFKYYKQKDVQKYDGEADGIIYDIDNGYPAANVDRAIIQSSITVRYLTKENVWITEKVEDTTSPSLYKKGEKIGIRYNLENPKDFIIVSSKQNALYYIFISVGILLICLGAILYYKSSASNN